MMSKHHNMGAKQRRTHMRTLFAIQRGRCAFCGEAMLDPDVARSERPPGCTTPRPDDPTVDHVTAKSTSGSNAITNLLLVHSRCNAERGDGLLPEAARLVWRANLIAIAVLRGTRSPPVACGACEFPHRCEADSRCAAFQSVAA